MNGGRKFRRMATESFNSLSSTSNHLHVSCRMTLHLQRQQLLFLKLSAIYQTKALNNRGLAG